MGARSLAALAVLAAAGALAWWFVQRANMKTALAEALRANDALPGRITRWADAIAAGAAKTAPSDFPGGAAAWAVFCASLMEEESQGGEANGYSPRGAWNGAGDRGNALTPWQLDKRYHAKYLAGADRTPESDSAYAMGLLADNWEHFADVDDAGLRQRATVAAYNASRARVDAALADGGDPDAATYPRAAGKVYAAEIVSRFDAWS